MPLKMTKTQKFLLDIAPLGAFFIGYRLGGVMLATVTIMAVSLACLAIVYVLERKIAFPALITGLVVTVFGGLTLWLNDEQFIKIKPTIINLSFSAILLVGAYGFKKGLLKYLFEMAFQLNDENWRRLSVRWGLFFAFLAVLNEVIWRNFPTDFWVNFKVFGMLSCTVLFTLSQIPFISRHSEDADKQN